MTDIKELLGRCMAFARQHGGTAGAQLAYEIGDVLIHEATIAATIDLSRTPSEPMVNELVRRHPNHIILIEHAVEGKPHECFMLSRNCLHAPTALGMLRIAMLNIEEQMRASRRQLPPGGTFDSAGTPIPPT
jgi:hypothetical protein